MIKNTFLSQKLIHKINSHKDLLIKQLNISIEDTFRQILEEFQNFEKNLIFLDEKIIYYEKIDKKFEEIFSNFSTIYENLSFLNKNPNDFSPKETLFKKDEKFNFISERIMNSADVFNFNRKSLLVNIEEIEDFEKTIPRVNLNNEIEKNISFDIPKNIDLDDLKRKNSVLEASEIKRHRVSAVKNLRPESFAKSYLEELYNNAKLILKNIENS